MREYIDVRGIWPIYFRGTKFLRLVGATRDVTLETARRCFDYMELSNPGA